MKTITLIVLSIFCASLISGCAILPIEDMPSPAPDAGKTGKETKEKVSEILVADEEGSTKIDNQVLENKIATNLAAQLSEAESLGVKFMLEEEKLARDVYAKFFEKWSLPIFDNISSSEHTHISAVRLVTEKYNIDTSFYDNKLGAFTNSHLKELYGTLLAQGSTSTVEALKVGALIEEIDLIDLEKYLGETKNKDLIAVYESLQKASRNHLRSFVKNILRNDGVYDPQKLNPEEFDRIISSPIEKGNID